MSSIAPRSRRPRRLISIVDGAIATLGRLRLRVGGAQVERDDRVRRRELAGERRMVPGVRHVPLVAVGRDGGARLLEQIAVAQGAVADQEGARLRRELLRGEAARLAADERE